MGGEADILCGVCKRFHKPPHCPVPPPIPEPREPSNRIGAK